jgi:hypothetical protein
MILRHPVKIGVNEKLRREDFNVAGPTSFDVADGTSQIEE